MSFLELLTEVLGDGEQRCGHAGGGSVKAESRD